MQKAFLAVVFAALILSLAFTSGCGDDDDDDDGDSTPGCGGDEACEACYDLLDAFCERMIECTNEMSMSECMDVAEDVFDCQSVIATTEDFDECLGAIGDADCDQLMDGIIPGICYGVLLVDE